MRSAVRVRSRDRGSHGASSFWSLQAGLKESLDLYAGEPAEFVRTEDNERLVWVSGKRMGVRGEEATERVVS